MFVKIALPIRILQSWMRIANLKFPQKFTKFFWLFAWSSPSHVDVYVMKSI